MFQPPRAAFAIALTAIAAASGAQTAAPAATDLQAANGAADLGYRSPFEGYQRFTQEQVGSWKAANDNVGRIGGWREYAKEARPPAAPAPSEAAGSGRSDAAPAAAPSGAAPAGAPPRPHAGHGQQ
jgi:hypothetical protein